MSTDGDSSSLASSLTDLMTSLAVIFVLLLAASLNNIRQGQEDAINSLRIALEQILKDFKKVGVDVRRDERDPLVLLVIVPSVFRFDYADDVIPPDGVTFLEQFTPKLVRTICAEELRDKVASVIIEGHADDNGTDKGNLTWSQKRASSVVLKSLEILNPPGQAVAEPGLKECFQRRISAAGRGNAEPLLDSDGRPDPASSRRVVFKIRMRSFEQEFTQIVSGGAALPAASQ